MQIGRWNMKKKSLVKVLLVIGSLMVFSLGYASSGWSQSQADRDYYKGKIVSYIVATNPGGGYDTYARMIAKHMEKYLGATIVVKNVPGAGHIIGANQIYLAKPDGLTLGTFNTGLIYSQIVGAEGIKFDLRKMSWIGKAAADNRVFAVGTNTPYKKVEDLKKAKEPIKMASSGVGATNHSEALILTKALNLNIKVIPGYAGRQPEMAILRGEVDGEVATYSSVRPSIDQGQERAIIQLGIKKEKDLPDVPTGLEIAPPQGRALVALVSTMAGIGRLTAATPGVPEGRVKVLVEAYKKALEDPALLTQADKMKIPIDAAFGEEVASMVKESLTQSPEDLELLKKILKP